MTTNIKPINLPVRFFMWDTEDEEGDFIECDESDFLDAEGVIEYTRHSVFANGVAQICLIKNPFSKC